MFVGGELRTAAPQQQHTAAVPTPSSGSVGGAVQENVNEPLARASSRPLEVFVLLVGVVRLP